MKYLIIGILASITLFGSAYNGSTISAVTLAGGIIKSTHIDGPSKKYERKNCPVCKGTGKYLSGDSIKMVDCGYCEPEKKNGDSEVIHPPVIMYQDKSPKCNGPNCRLRR